MTDQIISSPEGELLYGVPAIADFLGVTLRQALYLVEKSSFPTWREGRRVCARRSTVRAWMEKREQQAVVNRSAA